MTPIPATFCEIPDCPYKAVPGETWRCDTCDCRYCDACGSGGWCNACWRKAAHEAFLEAADQQEADERYVRRVGIFSGVKV